MKKVALILSGCGARDGSEIHESVLTHLALDRAGAQTVWVAPDGPQAPVINHLTGQVMAGESRQARVEAARIARGDVVPLSGFDVRTVDAVILPGGGGAARTLSDFASAGPAFTVRPELATVLRQARQLGKPMGFICVAPVIAAALFGGEGLEYTVGNDAETVAALAGTGARHLNCPVREVVVDRRLKIATTPAYMLAERIVETEAGINKLVRAVLEMA